MVSIYKCNGNNQENNAVHIAKPEVSKAGTLPHDKILDLTKLKAFASVRMKYVRKEKNK